MYPRVRRQNLQNRYLSIGRPVGRDRERARLKIVNLPWEDTDHRRRSKATLSRCKKGMLILTHHEFLLYWDVANPLVGRLAKARIPKADWVTLGIWPFIGGDYSFYHPFFWLEPCVCFGPRWVWELQRTSLFNSFCLSRLYLRLRPGTRCES